MYTDPVADDDGDGYTNGGSGDPRGVGSGLGGDSSDCFISTMMGD